MYKQNSKTHEEQTEQISVIKTKRKKTLNNIN